MQKLIDLKQNKIQILFILVEESVFHTRDFPRFLKVIDKGCSSITFMAKLR